MRRLLPLVLVALAVAAVATTAAGIAGTTQRGPGPGGVPKFVVHCEFSHRNTDDLIVFPAQPGRSHDHTYFGNRTTNASSTADSLRAAGSTCNRGGDRAAYWVPTLMSNGQPVTPLGATVYYRRRTADTVRAFPPGFRMIAGTSTATTAQPLQVTFWNCRTFGEASAPSSTIPTCATGARSALNLHVNFPSCWDGTSLDSADHRSHLAYAAGRRCPATHPVAVPAISLIVHYPSVNPATAELASRGQFSGHGDFVNALDQQKLEQLVQRNLNRIRRR